MNTYIKATITIILFGLCTSTMAEDRFIVKYKLSEAQKDFLSSHRGAEAKKAEARIREELMEKLSKEQLAALSAAAKVRVTDWFSLANGAHVITLSEDLDKTQTEQFIHDVEQDNYIEFIEEDKELQHCY